MTRRAKIVYLLIFICLASCKNRGEDSIYLIPKDFQGNLIIIFNQADGSEMRYEEGKRIYAFGKSGILKTKFQSNYGIQQNQYYYVDSLNNRTPIRYFLTAQSNGSDEVSVQNTEIGNDFDTTKKIRRHFELLTVSKQSNLNSIGNLRDNFMWEALK